MRRKHWIAIAALSALVVARVSSAGITLDAGDVVVASGPSAVSFSFPISLVLSGSTPTITLRSVDLKLRFQGLPDSTLRTVPVGLGAPVSFTAPDFGGTINPVQGTFLRAGAGPASSGFGQAISSSASNGLSAPANTSTVVFNFNFQIPANAPDATYPITIVSNDAGVLSLGTPDNELNFDTGDFSLATGSIRIVTVPVPAGNEWNVDASGLFTTNGNWTVAAPSGPTSVALFGTRITQPRTVILSAPATVGTLAFDNPLAAYTLAGAGSLSVNNGLGAAPVSVSSGNHTISVPLSLLANSTVAIAPGARLSVARLDAPGNAVSVTSGGTLAVNFLTAGSLSVTPNSLVDLGRGQAILTATTETAVRSLVSTFLTTGRGLGSTASGDPRDPFATLAVFNNSTFTGLPFYSTFNATSAPAGAILVMYTYKGDTNLDGILNGIDLANILEGYSNGLTGWQWGDIDYSGAVTVSDIQAYFDAFNNQGVAFTGGGSGSSLTSGTVPEPSAALSALPVAMLLGRRNRR